MLVFLLFMFIFYRHRCDFHRHWMNGNCYCYYRCYKKSVNYCFRSNSYFLMRKKNGCYYMKNGFPSSSTKNCFGKLHFRQHHSFFDKKEKNLYYLPYCVYCSDGCTKNLYLG